MVRIHRRVLEKLVYAGVYRCHSCGARSYYLHPVLDLHRLWFFSRYTRCPRCGTEFVTRVRRRDPIESISKHPISRIQGLLFAPLDECPSCRLQYHDWRPLSPQTRSC
jgi:uncharacterized Zn finger protein